MLRIAITSEPFNGVATNSVWSLLLVAICAATNAKAEAACVKYREPTCMSLDTFMWTRTESSVVHRVCYDAAQQYMLIKLRNTYYHYCEIPQDVVDALVAAPSKGRYYNRYIKGRGGGGPYDCRTRHVPEY